MKLNKRFTPCYSLCFNILHYPHIFTHLSPHLYFPFPTESLDNQQNASLSAMHFLYDTSVSKACFCKQVGHTKNAAQTQSDRILLITQDDGPRR